MELALYNQGYLCAGAYPTRIGGTDAATCDCPVGRAVGIHNVENSSPCVLLYAGVGYAIHNLFAVRRELRLAYLAHTMHYLRSEFAINNLQLLFVYRDA